RRVCRPGSKGHAGRLSGRGELAGAAPRELTMRWVTDRARPPFVSEPGAPGSDLLSDLDRVLDRGAEAVRVPHGKRHGVASRLGVDVADPLPPCDLSVAERPPERHDRAAGLPA